jgi:EAL domain-containing protein (putative c-di-GMP-specific phosphodiesterase class I)
VVGVSVGIAVGPGGDSIAAEQLLHDADVAMYDAKGLGVGYKLFDSAVSDRAASYFRIESDLREGLARNEITAYFQPVIELATGAIVGVEALTRWDRPGHGVIAAEDFIVPAERSGLIIPIGRHVLEQACAQLGEWQRMLDAEESSRPPLWLALNLSAPELFHDDFVSAVAEALSSNGLAPRSVVFEITERVYVNVMDSSAPSLGSLRDLGVRLSIDDFGIAYSSLGYVKHLSVDLLKIDRAFVQDLGSDPRSSAIVGAVIDMARSLGIAVVAEGVETPEQLTALQGLDCELGQGYHLGAPQPAAALTDLLRAGRPRSDQAADAPRSGSS